MRTVARRTRDGALCALAACAATIALGAAPASALSPWWHLTAHTGPTVLRSGHGGADGLIFVTAANLGDASANGASEPIVISDSLPVGVQLLSIEGRQHPVNGVSLGEKPTCSSASASCTFDQLLGADSEDEIVLSVTMAGAKSGAVNRASVTGGGASAASVSDPLQIGGSVPFGVHAYEMAFEEEGGGPDEQAGSHPFQVTTTMMLNQSGESETPALGKDLEFKLPPGFIGNPTPFARCSLAQFYTKTKEYGEEGIACPAASQVGIARVLFKSGGVSVAGWYALPLFNLEPSVGEPARFGFSVGGVPVLLDTALRTGSDYGVTVRVPDISEIPDFLGSEVTFWGVPGSSAHDASRGYGCLTPTLETKSEPAACAEYAPPNPPPLLSLPTSCTGELSSTVEADSWSTEGDFASSPNTTPMPALDGCNRLPFSSTISVAPDSEDGSSPSGLTVAIHVPQEEALNAEGLAPSSVRNTTVTLPQGVALNPAAADGLLSCSQSQIGLQVDALPSCPEASKVGTVTIATPLLPNKLEGNAYLAAQDENPFGSLVALYIVAYDPVSGSLVKLAGEVKLDPVSGQIVSTFLNTPQLPFENLELHFFGGARAPLGTPVLCGTYTTTESVTPWSGNPPSESSSSFHVSSGPNGAPCSDPPPFDPSLTAGMTSIQAGGFSPFTMTVSREDGQQNIGAIQLHMPPGLSGLLSGVELCGEAQADAGTCGPNSLIGETIVSVGLGGDPFSVTGGKVYITGPYEGAPFGLSVVVPAKAGPYNLGQVVVRGRIEVNPITAALTVMTNSEAQGYAIPHILDGIPLQIKHVNFVTTRPGFTFNPTNCEPMKVTGSMSSVEGAAGALSVPFQVTNCAVLGFKPGFAVSTSGKTSRAEGASLSVKLTYPAGSFGKDANIAKVKVDLPKQLPSRLTTLQKACSAATFEANPASCPVDSRVGQAKAITPLIPVPLEGPAYFVSHGGAKFPELIVVLQGYGVTLDLHGETFISPAGITSSTFATVPDAPVGSFELSLPEGPYSALAANGDLCTSKLAMPTAFVAQNGAEIHESTPISVTGCAKAKTRTRAQKLAAALKACHKKAKGERAACETAARKRYGTVKKTKKK